MKIQEVWKSFLSSPYCGDPCLQRLKNERAKFNYFIKWLKRRGVAKIDSVNQEIAMEFINELKKEGKLMKDGKTRQKISAYTINEYIVVCRKVFQYGVTFMLNPFAAIKKMKKDQIDREPFSQDEITLMMLNATGLVRHLLYFGLYTGLRKGDICTLRFRDLDPANRMITRKQNKTGTVVKIPMAEDLYTYIVQNFRHTKPEDYISPPLAKLYEEKESEISTMFKKFLNELQIKNTEKSGTGREVSVKDIHSLRHTFAYMAAKNNIPISTVQAILGHSDENVTKIYANHASVQDKRDAVETIESVVNEEEISTSGDGDLKDILVLVASMDTKTWRSIQRTILRRFKNNSE